MSPNKGGRESSGRDKNKTTSSAYSEMRWSTPPRINGAIEGWFLILIARGSIAIANNNGLRGQPCRQDHCNVKAGDLLLLVMTEAVGRA